MDRVLREVRIDSNGVVYEDSVFKTVFSVTFDDKNFRNRMTTLYNMLYQEDRLGEDVALHIDYHGNWLYLVSNPLQIGQAVETFIRKRHTYSFMTEEAQR